MHPDPEAYVSVPERISAFGNLKRIHQRRFPIGAIVRYLGSPDATVTSNQVGSTTCVLVIAWVDAGGRYNEVGIPKQCWHLVEVISVPQVKPKNHKSDADKATS